MSEAMGLIHGAYDAKAEDFAPDSLRRGMTNERLEKREGKPMAQDRLDLVRGIYDAFGSGDMDRVASRIADAEWHEAEGMPYGGCYRGAEEVFQNVFARIAADVENFSAQPDEILPAGDDRVLAVGRYAGTGRHGEVDVSFAHLWTVRDGKITKFVQYADTHKYRAAVGT